MDFLTAVKTCFGKYASFSGRASRAEYWYFVLFGILGTIATSVLDSSFHTGRSLNVAFSLIVLLPHLAVTARRLHDVGHSGWWQAAVLAPTGVAVIGAIEDSNSLVILAGIGFVILVAVLVVWICRAGDPGWNRFGDAPLPAVTGALHA